MLVSPQIHYFGIPLPITPLISGPVGKWISLAVVAVTVGGMQVTAFSLKIKTPVHHTWSIPERRFQYFLKPSLHTKSCQLFSHHFLSLIFVNKYFFNIYPCQQSLKKFINWVSSDDPQHSLISHRKGEFFCFNFLSCSFPFL